MPKRLAWLLIITTTGCGSSSALPAKATPANTPATNPSAPEKKPEKKPTLESQRTPFVDACLESMGSKEYCECGFAQFAALFKDTDFEKAPAPDDPRMEQLAVKMKEACADKFPEPKAQEQFVQSCTATEPSRAPYCNCAWAELRKSLSVSDILDYPPGNAKFTEARQGLPKACKGTYPAELASTEYLNACKTQGKKTQQQCQCMWKKVLKKYSVEELVVGTGDPTKIPDLDRCK